MPTLRYTPVPSSRPAWWVPKLGQEIESGILTKLLSVGGVLGQFMGKVGPRVYYRTTGGLYWKVFTDFAPAFFVNGEAGHSTRETWFCLGRECHVKPAIALLSSGLFWWWYTVTTNCRDLNPSDLRDFPAPLSVLDDPAVWELGDQYLRDIQANSAMLVRNQKQTGRTETQSFKIQKSKPLIDAIDAAVAPHYELGADEVDFIRSYDIEYRLGVSDEE
jgi:hypothetical protein